MKDWIKPKTIIFALLAIYLVISIERNFVRQDNESAIIGEYEQNKAEMIKEVNALENDKKQLKYEKQAYKDSLVDSRSIVYNWNAAQRDSARNVLNPR